MEQSPEIVFALVLKRWFKQNGWPQKITDDWCKDPGIKYPHGPWASQVCGAMQGKGYNPKTEFFLAFGRFNQFVGDGDFKAINDRKLKDRLIDSIPLTTDGGKIFTATDFWSLYAGEMEPPSQYASHKTTFSQDDADSWVQKIRSDFRELALQHMIDRPEAWKLLRDQLQSDVSDADLSMIQGILSGMDSPTAEQLNDASYIDLLETALATLRTN